MKYGMNLLLWSGEVSDNMLPTIEKLKQLGYDGVELPLFNLDLDYAGLGKKLDSMGLERTASLRSRWCSISGIGNQRDKLSPCPTDHG